MNGFHENASSGSHDKPLLVCRGLVTTFEKPTMNSEYEFIVATPTIFMGGSELVKVMGHFHINMCFNSHGHGGSGKGDPLSGWSTCDYSRNPDSPQMNPGKRGLRCSSVRATAASKADRFKNRPSDDPGLSGSIQAWENVFSAWSNTVSAPQREVVARG